MIRIARSLIVVASLAAALVAPAVVSAQTVDECRADIAGLRSQTTSATFVGRQTEKERTGLVTKLDNASAALAAGKNADAIAKLDDFRAKVVTLGETGKLSSADAAALTGGADEAIACISALPA